MKIIKFFTILITPLIVGIACCFILLKICNIHVGSVTNFLLAKIPLVNQFVETTSNTGLYAIKQIDKKELVTSSYNVDFLVSFYQSGKKTIILYPYVVEAGINLEYAEQKKQDSLTVITLPNAQITKATISNEQKDYIIREQVDIASEYNKLITPLKIALERRAKDLAISAGILSDANKNAEEYLLELFNNKNIHIKKEEAPFDSLKTISASHLPITFTYQDENLTDGKLNYQKDSIFSRIDLNLNNIKLTYGGFTTFDFQEQDQSQLNSDYLYLRLIDPLNPQSQRTYIQGEYEWGAIHFFNGLYCFLEGSSESKEELQQKIAPDMLYLIMGASLKPGDIDPSYLKWAKKYLNCIECIEDKLYLEAATHLKEMANLRGNMPISSEEKILSAFIQLKNGIPPTQCNEQDFDLWFKTLYAFDHQKINNKELQNSILALKNKDSFIENNYTRLLQLFYCSNVDIETKKRYKDEIIQRADKYDQGIASTLKGEDYCDYICRILLKDPQFCLYQTQPSNAPKTKVILHKYKNQEINEEFKDANWIVQKLKQEKVFDEHNEQVVIAFVEEGTIFDDHNLLIIRKNSCSICSNVTGKLFYGKNITTSYNNITASIENNHVRFKIGKYEYEDSNGKEATIVKLLKDIKEEYHNNAVQKQQMLFKDIANGMTDHVSELIINRCF